MNSQPSRSPSTEDEDDDISLYSLEKGISRYIQESDSTFGHEYYPGVERIDYDFTQERLGLVTRPTNLIESTGHLIKSCLGAGIFGMHEAFMHGGLWFSMAAGVIMGLIMSYCMYMLVKSAQEMYLRLRVPKLTYPDLAEVALATGPLKGVRRYSKIFRYTVDCCLFCELCGACCVYQIMIAQIIKRVTESISWTFTSDIRIHILIATVPLLVLCMIKSLKYLAPLSLAADCIITICVLLIIGYSLTIVPKITERASWKSLRGFFRFCGMFIFSIEGVGVALPIENNMRTPKYFPTIMQIAMTVVVISVIVVGFFGYWAWGENCKSPSIVDLPPQTAIILIQLLLALTLCVTFALNFWVPVRIVWRYLGRKLKRKRGYWERFYRAMHILLITVVSVACHDVSNLMIFVGDVLIAVTAFVFPAFIESLVTWKDRRRGWVRWVLVKDVLIIMFGLTLNLGSFFAYWYN